MIPVSFLDIMLQIVQLDLKSQTTKPVMVACVRQMKNERCPPVFFRTSVFGIGMGVSHHSNDTYGMAYVVVHMLFFAANNWDKNFVAEGQRYIELR